MRPGCPDFTFHIGMDFGRRKALQRILSVSSMRRCCGLGRAAVRQRLTDVGQEIFPPEQQTPETLGTLQKAEIEKWWPIIKEAGIKPELIRRTMFDIP